MSKCFLFLSLENKRCLVVGGGQVAERKVDNLLGYSAHIEVISPDASQHLQQLAHEERIVWVKRTFIPDDLPGAFLVFAATDNLEVNRQVAELCHQQALLVNAVDDPEYCDYYIPSTIRRNSLEYGVHGGILLMPKSCGIS
jgi:precorrin-2 dehydrogenase/sirohydrochlorin ferrochelatase